MTAARLPPEPMTAPDMLESPSARLQLQGFMTRVLRELSEIRSIAGSAERKADAATTGIGEIMAELGSIVRRLDKIRPDSDRPISHHDLEEFREELTTSPGMKRPSLPVRDKAQLLTGKVVWWLLGLTFAGVWADVVVRLLHR